MTSHTTSPAGIASKPSCTSPEPGSPNDVAFTTTVADSGTLRSGPHSTAEQALEVSDHFPVWAEFSAYERDYTGRIASRRTSAR